MAQQGPRTKRAQERSKRGPGGYVRCSRTGTLIGVPLVFNRCPPRWPQERSEGSQERPKMAPRGT
eukprot:8943346-Pyramimonas_sp.AAC.1